MKYLSKRTVANQLDVSIRTVDRWIARHLLKTKIMVTGSVRIPETELEKMFKPSIQEFLDDK
ncbi:MAG: hypothetical protein HOD37_04185 [Bacteroidetes bacterium]|jgi:excisionase family DNA binding protein|nr:hypothetical protein [Bacteroidota bacterium]